MSKVSHTQWENAAARTLSSILGSTNADGPEMVLHNEVASNPLKVAFNAKRGIIRHLCIILDASDAANEKEWHPSKLLAISGLLKKRFFKLFFESNPIGQLSMIATSKGTAAVLVPPTCDPDLLLEKFNASRLEEGIGSASLENALRLAVALFQYVL